MLESRNLLKEKWRESLASVLPITIIVFLICFFKADWIHTFDRLESKS